MKKNRPVLSDWVDTPRISQPVNYRTSELIRLAEANVAAGKYALALDQLTRAHNTEPHNKYIDAIIERVLTLQRENSFPAVNEPEMLVEPPADASRYLSVTVGKEFKGGIKPAEPGPVELPSPERKPLRPGNDYTGFIRELTDIAQEFVKLGLAEPAFDALMKAYILDPLSPDVLRCEKDVLPAWNLARAARANTNAVDAATSAPPALQEPDIAVSDQTTRETQQQESSVQSATTSADDEEERLKILMRQKEEERLERERAVWREASSFPRIFWDDFPQEGDTPSPPGGPRNRPLRRIINRLRRTPPSP